MAEGSGKIASKSANLLASSQVLADGASHQVASVQKTTASVEEMSAMTQHTAQNTEEAKRRMTEVKQRLEKVEQALKKLTASMEEISAASENAAKIVKTIDEISFQTNLLSLNAAVEAARAGEAGSGFAVVADEVRNLAVRAAEAAKNTAVLIEGTVIRIREGKESVLKTNETFHEVSSSSLEVAGFIDEIFQGTAEQAEGLGQISNAIIRIDKIR